jgi:hypothetical protein
MTIAGACLCGALAYEVEGRIEQLLHCHCGPCRKQHGAPFATHAVVASDRLRWRREEAPPIEHTPPVGRARRSCSVCGAVAPTTVGDHALVPAGNLVGDLGEVEAMHVHVADRAPWHVIADDLPQHAGMPPGWPAVDATPPAADAEEGTAHGSCTCGEVRFALRGAPARWYQCHCSRCRRGRSAAHGSNAFHPAGQLSWLGGRELVRSFVPPDATRFTVSFCVRCGGGAPVEREGVPFVLVPAGIVDGDLPARPQAHIHVASKAPWWTIRDAIPQFDELPPA